MKNYVVLRTDTKKPKYWARTKLDYWTLDLQQAELFTLSEARTYFEGMGKKVSFIDVEIKKK